MQTVPKPTSEEKVQYPRSNICNRYIVVQDWQKVHSGPRLENITKWSEVGKGYLMVQADV